MPCSRPLRRRGAGGGGTGIGGLMRTQRITVERVAAGSPPADHWPGASPPDYASAFSLRPPGSPRPALGWLRGALEGAPAPLRGILRLGWRLALRLRLAPSTEVSVLGWKVVKDSPQRTVIAAPSPLITCCNVLDVTEEAVQWTTFVSFRHPLARPVWALVAPVHHCFVPFGLRLAAARPGTGQAGPPAPAG